MICQDCQHHFIEPELGLGCTQHYHTTIELGANRVWVGRQPPYLDGGAETCPSWSEQKLGRPALLANLDALQASQSSLSARLRKVVREQHDIEKSLRAVNQQIEEILVRLQREAS